MSDRYDPNATPAITLDDLDVDQVVSPPYTFRVLGRDVSVQFRLLSQADKRRIQRQAEIYVNADYAAKAGANLPPGAVCDWINTTHGLESVLDETWLRTVVAATLYDTGDGKLVQAFDMATAREHFTHDHIQELQDQIAALEARYCPDEWSDELFAAMLDDAKKNRADSLLSYGAARLATCLVCLVELQETSPTEPSSPPPSGSGPQSATTGERPSTESPESTAPDEPGMIT